jgi:arylsulfatase A-like enzyme
MLGLGACTGEAPAPHARNLILISLDTLRADHLGSYGHRRDTSPAIDALAARGVRFADASATAPWTLPSHATMFTGLYPSRHGVKDYSHRLPERSLTLAEILAGHGYQTLAVASAWNIADPRFALFQGFAAGDVHYVKETREGAHGRVVPNTGPEVVARARALLEGRDRTRPFFLFVHFYDTHTDFSPEPAYRARFVSPYGGKLDGSTRQLEAIRRRGLRLSPADLRFLRELYDAEIRQLDDLLGDFFASLDESGVTGDTLVVLTSDHGEEFQEHGSVLHGRTQYEELLRVPLILAGPGIPAGRVVEAPVALVDLLPTLLGRLGLPAPPGLDGLDLAPTWTGGALPERALFAEADHHNRVEGQPMNDIKRSARIGDDKLHLDRHTGQVELFNLSHDPGEQEDLAAAFPERVAPLRAALDRFLAAAVAGETSGAELSAEEVELLRSLGYVQEGEAP